MKKIALGFILLLVLCWVLFSLPKINIAEAEPKTIVVPDDYLTIGWAIGNASEGDTIFVKKGTYYEHVTINKSISLIGENRSTTVIDGDRSGTPVEILSNNVIVSGFTIRNSSTSYPHQNGIYILSNGCLISNNIITNNYWAGILISAASDNTIINNVITNNHKGIEIFFGSPVGNNTISGNTIALNDWYGIYIVYSSDNKIYHNNFIDNRNQTYSTGSINTWDNGYPSGGNYWSDYEDRYPDAEEINGSGIWDTPYVIYSTTAAQQDDHPLIHLYGSIRNLDTNLTYLTIQSAIDAPETLNGQMILVDAGTYYEHVLINKSISLIGEDRSTTVIDGNGTGNVVTITTGNASISGFTMQNGGFDQSCIYLSSSSGVTINDNAMSNNFEGIRLNSSNGNDISDNLISPYVATGIFLEYSNGNVIRGNIINPEIGLDEIGILLTYSTENSIINNTILNNVYDGIKLIWDANANVICGNNIKDNGKGVHMVDSGNNTFYHNNFINNGASCDYANTWDNGYPLGGNYWSDYTGVDADGDGIGDTPYVIDADNKDHYPLVHPWSPFPVHNINTGLGYAAIQEAINAPETLDGHTVFVEAGTYYENLVVNKTVSLFGENIDTTIIDGSETGNCVNVTASSTKISGFTIQNGGSTYASVRLFTSGNTILNNNLINSWCGVWMEHYSDYNLIANNTIMGNLNGIAGEIWHNTKIIGNTIKDNLMGIGIGPYSQNNIISFNNINGHWSEGIMMMQSSNNTFEGNNIVDNNQGGFWAGITIGFQKGFSSGNKFFHNNIANIGKQIELQGESEPVIWDDGYPSGGNYWSDYTGVDYHSGTYQNETGSDGVGDTPYTVAVNNQDNCPLMGRFSVFNATSEYHIQTICNSSISDFQFNGTAISFNVSGEEGTTGFCRMCIPTALMETYNVFVNGTEAPHTLLLCSNSTNSYLYFTYNHSTQEVIVIPEFPTWTPMLLLFVVLTITIGIYKRRRLKTSIH